MKISTHGDFAADCHEVFAILADPDFQDRLAATPGSHASVTHTGARTVIRSHRILPTAGMPDFAKTFVGDTITLTEVQEWGPAAVDGSRTGTVALEIEGAPVSLAGTVGLHGRVGGSALSVQADVRARVPLVGNRVEKAAAPAIEAAIHAEYDLIREALSAP